AQRFRDSSHQGAGEKALRARAPGVQWREYATPPGGDILPPSLCAIDHRTPAFVENGRTGQAKNAIIVDAKEDGHVFDERVLFKRVLFTRRSIESHVDDQVENQRGLSGSDGGGHRRPPAGAAGAGPEGGKSRYRGESKIETGLGRNGTDRSETGQT